MTVSSQTNNATFVGNGVTTVFPLPFRFFANGDVFAYFIDSTTGASTPMSLGVDYTLTGAGEPEVNGNAVSVLTTTAPLANGRGLYVERIMQEVQSTDIVNQGEFFASTHEDVFDRLTMLIQQSNSNSQGAIRVAIGDPEPTRLVPAVSRANMLLGFDSSGNPIAVVPVSGSASELALNLQNNSDYLKGSSLVGWIRNAIGAIGRTVFEKISATVSIEDFGAVQDGITDCGPALRKALDSLPAWGGKVVFEGPGPYYFPTVVYIPQRTTLFGSPGIIIEGNGSRVIGGGANTWLESGTGQYSTVALGGASNFGQPSESVASIHYNTHIKGFKISNFGTAIRLYNFIIGCSLRDLYASDISTMVYVKKCFYIQYDNVQGRPLDSALASTSAIFDFDTDNNTITLKNVHASGIDAGGIKRGIGFKFAGGVQALNFTDVSAEGCVTGLRLTSFIYNMNVDSVYFENNTTHIDGTGAVIPHMSVDNCWFDSGTTAITCDGWAGGKLGNGNYFSPTAGAVTLTGCTLEVYLPNQTLTELDHTSWTDSPAGWTLGASCKIVRNDVIYNSAVGFGASWFRNNPSASGNGVVPLSYTGECFNITGTIPYCTVSGVGTGTLTVTTKIKWNANLSAVRFDLLVAHSSNAVIAGVLSANSAIFRDDAVAGITITPSDAGGFLRLTFAGFGTITSFSGKVRVI